MAATRYRNLESPSLIDVGARSTPTGAANASEALAYKFASFARTAADVGALAVNFGAKKQAELGTAEGLAGKPQLRKGIRSMTAYGQAYNSAAEAGYSARVQVDVDDNLRRFEDESEANPEAFAAKVAAYSEGLMAESPETMRDRVGLILKARAASGSQRVRDQFVSKTRAQAHADFISGLPAQVNNTLAMLETLPPDEADAALTGAVQDNREQLHAMVRDNVIDPLTAGKYEVQFQEALGDALDGLRIGGTLQNMTNVMRNDVEAGDALLASLEARTDLSTGDKELIRDEYQKARENLVFERSRTHVEETGEFVRALTAGVYGAEAEDINRQLYRRAAISTDEYEGNIATMTRNAKEGDDKNLDMETIYAAMRGELRLDPADKKARDALDVAWKAETAAAGMTIGDDRWQASAVQMAERTNILPASAESWARVAMTSGNYEQAAQGAGFFERVRRANPTAWSYNADPKVAAFADQLNANLQAGVVTQQAFDLARKNTFELDDNARRLLSERYREEKVPESNVDALQSALSSDESFDVSNWPTGHMAPSLTMLAEYDGLVREYYLANNGNVEAAQKLAADAVMSTHAVSRVNGDPAIMKYAPEKMYGMAPEIVRADLDKSLADAGVAASSPVHLVAGPETELSQGLDWRLATTDEYGMPDAVLDDKNMPLIYRLPIGPRFEEARATQEQRMRDDAQAAKTKLEGEIRRNEEVKRAAARRYGPFQE